MNTNRFIEILNFEFAKQKLVVEEELERIINSDIETTIKIETIKELLNKLVILEQSNEKLISMTKK